MKNFLSEQWGNLKTFIWFDYVKYKLSTVRYLIFSIMCWTLGLKLLRIFIKYMKEDNIIIWEMSNKSLILVGISLLLLLLPVFPFKIEAFSFKFDPTQIFKPEARTSSVGTGTTEP